MTKLFIWGCGGHAKVVFDAANESGRFQEIVFIDDACTSPNQKFMGCEVAGGADQLAVLRQRGFEGFLIAIGHNETRAKCYSTAIAAGFNAAIALHPSAVVSRSALIGPGTVVLPRAVINASASIGVNCIINSGAIVEHDCLIGEHTHISPGAALGGCAKVGNFSHVGINASILPAACVGDHAVVGAGAVVLKSVESHQVAAGVPARPIQKKKHA